MFEGSVLSTMLLSLGCYGMVALAILGLISLACIETLGSSKEISNSLVLEEQQKNQIGYTSTIDKSNLLGEVGICNTDLRPAGSVIINGEPFDVITEGDFINKGANVKVINTDSSRIVVRKI